ncbi:hypothetical protein J2W15_003611 [Pseudarthrobacter sulfonivorans]|nr:hypothetical protein [Pseudarthrobacter sulfonivorans]
MPEAAFRDMHAFAAGLSSLPGPQGAIFSWSIR